MKLIVGLGNPGSRYESTRHNVGFMLIDKLARKHSVAMREGKGEYFIGECTIGDERTFLMKPTTYMNNSGLAVRPFMAFFKIPVSDVLIACDDVVLPLGTIRMRKEGSDGGQNGLKSVIYQLATDQIARLRIGVDHPLRSKMSLSDFVLSRFLEDEMAVLNLVMDRATLAAESFVQHGVTRAMNQYNGGLPAL